ncbi:MAG: enoyl-CoA hydratase/isomerase family protein [Saprospiraceae bacterium]|nr:enoyl-CoA hydratase/isomerase family protein [Saprospiraceae bacterium]
MDALGTVDSVIQGSVAWITFGHPDHNSLPLVLLDNLARSIESCEKENVKIIVLQSAGNRTFCAGANFSDMLSCKDLESATDFFKGFGRVLLAIRNTPALVIARLQGKAVGGGVGIAAAADYAMGTKWSLVRLSELFIGLGPYVIGPALERKMGLSAFSQLAINSTEWQTAEWAKSKGLLHEVFDTAEQMDDYLDRFLEELQKSSSEALRGLKEILWKETEDWEKLMTDRAAISAKLLLKEETQARIKQLASQMSKA